MLALCTGIILYFLWQYTYNTTILMCLMRYLKKLEDSYAFKQPPACVCSVIGRRWPLMSRIERRDSLIGTSFMTGLFDINFHTTSYKTELCVFWWKCFNEDTWPYLYHIVFFVVFTICYGRAGSLLINKFIS